MAIHLSQESQLLLLCARTRVGEAEAARIQALLPAALNWEELIAMAHRQGVLPLVTGNLKTLGSQILPPSVLEQMVQRTQAVAVRNLSLTHELVTILQDFKAAQILALPFKGSTLASLAYGNIASRQFIDLDILIPRHQIRAARDLLLEQGYQTKLSLSESEEEEYLQTQLGYDFVHSQRRLSVELHWNLLQRWLSYPARVEEIWDQPQPVQIGRTQVHTLALHHLLPYLCAHATKHGWAELKWVCDVSELVQSQPELDWDRVLEQAESLRSLRMLLLGLSLAETLLGTPLPQEVHQLIQRDTLIPELVREVEGSLFAKTTPPGSWRDHLFFLRSREHFEDRWIYLSHLGRLTLQPSDSDRSWVPLPPSLEFLYLLLRPFRVLSQSILERYQGQP